MFIIPGTSPVKMMMGTSTNELKKFEYQLKAIALPWTTSRPCLIVTECDAVIAELMTPKEIPRVEMDVPSRNTPTKKPAVTMLHARRERREGRT